MPDVSGEEEGVRHPTNSRDSLAFHFFPQLYHEVHAIFICGKVRLVHTHVQRPPAHVVDVVHYPLLLLNTRGLAIVNCTYDHEML
jgi:hypothetical protein